MFSFQRGCYVLNHRSDDRGNEFLSEIAQPMWATHRNVSREVQSSGVCQTVTDPRELAQPFVAADAVDFSDR